MKFSEVFGAEAEFGIRAPGRINLIGEHIDYLDGFVMPMAINRAIYSYVSPNNSDQIRIWTSITDQVVEISTDDCEIREGKEFWLNYPVGVLSVYREKGIECPGFDIAIDTDLPTGAGLSSSAALEMTFALAIEKLSGRELDVVERAELCQHAEHEFAGVPCGIMDQMAVAACQEGMGLMIDCQSNHLTPVSIPEGFSIVVADTRVKHALGDGEYKKRCEDCAAALDILPAKSWRDATIQMIEEHEPALGDRLFRRARHAVTEMARVEEFAEALAVCDIGKIGQCLRASHDSLRDDYEVSCAELDVLVDAAYRSGAIGSRMTGGGFGGSTISIVSCESAPRFIADISEIFQSSLNQTIEPFVTSAAAGASYI